MKNKNKDFLDCLLQPFNFQASAGDAPVAMAATESEEEYEFEEEPPPTEEEKEGKKMNKKK